MMIRFLVQLHVTIDPVLSANQEKGWKSLSWADPIIYRAKVEHTSL